MFLQEVLISYRIYFLCLHHCYIAFIDTFIKSYNVLVIQLKDKTICTPEEHYTYLYLYKIL